MSTLPGRVGNACVSDPCKPQHHSRRSGITAHLVITKHQVDALDAGPFWAGVPMACCQTARTGSGCARECSSLPATRDSTGWAAWPSALMEQIQAAAALRLRISTRRQSSPQTQVLQMHVVPSAPAYP